MLYKDLQDRRATLSAAVVSAAGKKGVTALRAKLAEVTAELDEKDARRQAMRRAAMGPTITARPPWRPDAVRYAITVAGAASVKRGAYGEISVDAAVTAVPVHARTHPRLAHLWEFFRATEVISSCDRIPTPWADFTRGEGTAVNVALYGWSAGGALAIVQVRRTEVGRRYKRTSYDYIVVDEGGEWVSLPVGVKGTVKRAVAADPDDPGAALRAVREHLPAQMAARIPDVPLRLKVGGKMITYKVVRQQGEDLVSLYDPAVVYRLGVRTWDAMARDAGGVWGKHGGGLYSYPDRRKLVSLWTARKLVPQDCVTRGVYVILRCEASGRIAYFDRGKIASSYLTPLEVVAYLTVA